MQLVTFDKQVLAPFRKSSGQTVFQARAGETYVTSDVMKNQFLAHSSQEAVGRVSELEPRLPNFNFTALPGSQHPQSILFYAGSGGYGDQIMAWSVAKYMAYRGHRVTALTDPGNEVCWQNFPWLQGIVSLPLEYERMRREWKHYAFFERVVNADAHPGQEHPTDAMFHRMGVHGAPHDSKVTAPIFTPEDLDTARMFQDGHQHAIFQVCASTPSRNLSAEQAAFLLARLAEAHPDLHWIVLSDDYTPTVYVAKVKNAQRQQRNISMLLTSNLRAVWALIASSRVVVSPDSMAMHVAGVTHTPCVAYFGATDPDLRMCYYPTVVPLGSATCPYAPCLHPGAGFPPFCPGRDLCTEIESVSTEAVLSAVASVYRREPVSLQ